MKKRNTERNTETISAATARAWRAPMPKFDPELDAVLVRAWRASHTAARAASVVANNLR
ncbi:hypothetical protein MASR1M60_22510 [Rhodocyclaceae bacterium]